MRWDEITVGRNYIDGTTVSKVLFKTEQVIVTEIVKSIHMPVGRHTAFPRDVFEVNLKYWTPYNEKKKNYIFVSSTKEGFHEAAHTFNTYESAARAQGNLKTVGRKVSTIAEVEEDD